MEPDSTTPEKFNASRPRLSLADHTAQLHYVDDDEETAPHPVQIVNVDPETRQFYLDEPALAKILLSEKCRHRPVSVVSIAGDFRKGKSFLLNFLLKYLDAKGYEKGDTWLKDVEAPLKGFSWRGGSDRDTTGILMWSEPFIVPLKNGQDCAVLLMDTQGAFDSEYTVKDSATVFALSTMTSSIQVFNVLHNLQEDNLQVLQTFTEYGRLALEKTESIPFQNLVFLIRDWSFGYEHEFGLEGGKQLLEKKLIVNERQPEQLQRVRKHIKSCFDSILCFLMPHPGKKVATNPKFDGRQVDIDEEFLQHLEVFVPLLLSPENLVVKKINGNEVTGTSLMEYFKVYIKVFQGEDMPEPMNMMEATAEANNRAAVAISKNFYLVEMEAICGGAAPFINPKELERKHLGMMGESLRLFRETKKMGGDEYSEKYIEELEKSLLDHWTHFEAQNNSKNVFSLLGAPLVLLAWICLCYIISSIFGTIGIAFIANLFTFFASTSIVVLLTYCTMRYGGTAPEFIAGVDSMAEQVHNFVMECLFKTMQKAVEQRTALSFPNNGTSVASPANSTRSGAILTRIPSVNTSGKVPSFPQ